MSLNTTSSLALRHAPNLILLGAVLICALLLSFPVSLPIGSYYADVFIYADAAWRIANHQLPHIDFFAPAGALEYLQYAWLQKLLPDSHMLLAAQFSVGLTLMPIMAFVIYRSETRSHLLPVLLVIPFVLLLILPLNTVTAFELSSVDGYGIYNRHCSIAIYTLVCAVLFMKRDYAQAIVIGLLSALIFFTKVTGMCVVIWVLLHAFIAARLGIKPLVFAGGVFLLVLTVVELSTGISSAYVRDISVIAANVAPSSFQTLFRTFVTSFLSAGWLLLLPIALAWSQLGNRPHQTALHELGVRPLFNSEAGWMASLILVSAIFETQNFGNWAHIFVWPVVMLVFIRCSEGKYFRRSLVLASIVLAFSSGIQPILARTASVLKNWARYPALEDARLQAYGAVRVGPEVLTRSIPLTQHFAEAAESYRKLAEASRQVRWPNYSEVDYQVNWLASAGEAYEALLSWERLNSRRLTKIIVLDLADIFTPLLRREPVRLLPIGMAPGRTIPPLTGERLTEALGAEALLAFQCPVTAQRLDVRDHFQVLLEGTELVSLTPCWSLYVRRPRAL